MGPEEAVVLGGGPGAVKGPSGVLEEDQILETDEDGAVEEAE